MDRLQFQFDPDDDVTDRYRRLVGAKLAEHDRAERQDAWADIVEALTHVRDTAEHLGLGAAALDALDATLRETARVAARGQRVAFDAGLRAGAALAGLQGPTVN